MPGQSARAHRVRCRILCLCLVVIALASVAFAEPLNLAWDAVTAPDLCCYIVYWGTTNGGPYPNSTNVGNVTTTSIGNLSPSTVYYFVVKARDITGNESLASNETSGRPRRVITY